MQEVTMARTVVRRERKEELMNRLKRIEGHIRGVQRMVEEDAYCIDIIRQTQAVKSAIDRFNTLILEHHLNHCITNAIRSDDPVERERVIGELLEVFEEASKM